MAAIADGIADNLTDTVRCGVQRIFLIAVYLRNTGSPRHLDNGGLRSVDDAIRADNLLSGRTGHRNGDKPSAKTFGQCLNGTFTAIGKRAFANCVAVIFPLCALSAVIYLLRTGLRLVTALPYLVGGLAGGFVGGKLFGKVSAPWLRRIFGVFLVYGGVRYLL